MQPDNLFSEIPAILPEELVDVLITHSHIRLERIVSKGHASPEGFWYDQAEHEWVLVVQGEALLLLEGAAEPIRMKQGMLLNAIKQRRRLHSNRIRIFITVHNHSPHIYHYSAYVAQLSEFY